MGCTTAQGSTIPGLPRSVLGTFPHVRCDLCVRCGHFVPLYACWVREYREPTSWCYRNEAYRFGVHIVLFMVMLFGVSCMDTVNLMVIHLRNTIRYIVLFMLLNYYSSCGDLWVDYRSCLVYLVAERLKEIGVLAT